jgi:hypothetical protein
MTQDYLRVVKTITDKVNEAECILIHVNNGWWKLLQKWRQNGVAKDADIKGVIHVVKRALRNARRIRTLARNQTWAIQCLAYHRYQDAECQRLLDSYPPYVHANYRYVKILEQVLEYLLILLSQKAAADPNLPPPAVAV